MTRAAAIAKLRELMGNRWLTFHGEPGALFVDFRDLEDVKDQKALAAFLSPFDKDASDKDLILKVEDAQ